MRRWIGDVNAGMQFTLKDEHYVRPLNTNFYQLEAAGRADIVGQRRPRAAVRSASDASRQRSTGRPASAGRDVLEAGRHAALRLPTADHAVPPDRYRQRSGRTRYFHALRTGRLDRQARRQPVNVHHATPNQSVDQLSVPRTGSHALVHRLGARPRLKVKIYYTVRELTNHAPELFDAAHASATRCSSHGPGGGHSWLQEHVGSDYLAGVACAGDPATPRWCTAACLAGTTSTSRACTGWCDTRGSTGSISMTSPSTASR